MGNENSLKALQLADEEGHNPFHSSVIYQDWEYIKDSIFYTVIEFLLIDLAARTKNLCQA